MERGPLFLRGVALERLCLMHLDNDDLDSARAAFVKAQQALPDSPTLAYIEAMLLLHEAMRKRPKSALISGIAGWCAKGTWMKTSSIFWPLWQITPAQR